MFFMEFNSHPNILLVISIQRLFLKKGHSNNQCSSTYFCNGHEAWGMSFSEWHFYNYMYHIPVLHGIFGPLLPGGLS